MKICIKCLVRLSFEDFYRHPQTKDGFLGRCKECHKSAMRICRQLKLEYYKEYDRSRIDAPHRKAARDAYAKRLPKEKRLQYGKSFMEGNPEKRAAHIAVGNAVRDGVLLKKPCEHCGDGKVQAHHEDYSMQLAVIWLCGKCHGQAHRRKNEMTRFVASQVSVP